MSCTIPANPDVSGIGVRVAIYIQNFLCFVPAVWAIWDGHVSDYELESAETHSTTNLVLAFAILISCIFQAIARGLTNYHASIVLGLSWMNNTNAFVYFLLYVQHKSQGGAGGVEPTLSSWATHIKKQLLTILCVPDGLARRPSIRKREPGTIVAKNAAGVIFKRIALFLGSLHLTLMAALGIWLWSSPQSFGAIESACATQVADLAVLGARVRFGSQALRVVSLTIYSLLLVPGINLLLPMSLFLGFHCWYHSRRSTQPTLPQHNSNVQPSTLPVDARLKRVLPVCVGLGFLLAVNIAFMTDVELTLRRNGGVQESGESDWGFGQILAILLVFMPLRDLTEAIIRRRQDMLTKLNGALKKAIGDKDLDGVTIWINAGADLNVRGDDGSTAWQTAVQHDKHDIISLLLNRGVDVNELFNDGSTALQTAVLLGKHDAISLLLNRADVNNPFTNGLTAWQTAVLHGKHDTISLLIRLGANVNEPFNDGKTALEVVALSKRWSVLQEIVQAGAAVNKPINVDGKTVLECVSINAQWNLAKDIVTAGADFNIKFGDGRTLLEAAIRAEESEESTSLIQDVVKAGADVNKEFSDGRTALEVATWYSKWDMVRILVMAGADVNKEFKNSGAFLRTCLHVACLEGREDVVTLLLQHNANPNSKAGGATPLYCASCWGHVACIKALLDGGADVNIQDRDGDTGLHVAGHNHNVDCLKVLLEHGADASIRNRVGWTALQLAKKGYNGKKRFSEISDLFQSYGVVE